VWVQRDGTEELVTPQLRFRYYSVSLSPLGSRIAFEGREEVGQLVRITGFFEILRRRFGS
jgi:hypothetical protein